jgi:3-oxoacyl-[acyl-carrier protein] reductase
VLVNNAGPAIPKPFEETNLEELDRVIDINIRGTFVTTHAALKHLNNDGRIIMIGSCVGALSREVGSRGITVNNVQPGPIDTDLNRATDQWAVPQLANTALKRYGHVEDVAELVAFVASPEAAYITGASLTVDGGTNA